MSENLTINIISKGEISVVYPTGYLDAHTAPALEEKVRELLDNENSYKIVFNLKDLDYISSAGLGVFMSFVEEIRGKDGDIKFSNLTDKVYSVLELLGFPMLFDITKTEDQAIEKFSTSVNEQ